VPNDAGVGVDPDNGGDDCQAPQVPNDAGLCVDPGNGSGGNNGNSGGNTGNNGGNTGGNSGGNSGANNGGHGTGQGSTDGNTTPEGTVIQTQSSSVPLNSGCSDPTVCQAAAVTPTSTTSGGLPDTGAPAHTGMLVGSALALIVMGLGLVVSPRRRRVEI
jgi:LPXTG-motif cell wall-anchored protein